MVGDLVDDDGDEEISWLRSVIFLLLIVSQTKLLAATVELQWMCKISTATFAIRISLNRTMQAFFFAQVKCLSVEHFPITYSIQLGELNL